MRLRWKHRSIRLRLAITYTAVLLATCAAILVLNYALLYHSLYTRIGAPTASEVTAMARTADRNPNDRLKVTSLEQDLTERARLRNETLLQTAETSAVALAIAALLGLGVSWVVAGRVLRPLRTLTTAARRVSQDRLHERIALAGPRDELRELADTFDEMVARLEDSFTSQRRFVADAAHELRTPLAILRTSAEVQLSRQHSTPVQWETMAHHVLTATDRAERLLAGLLALARSDSGVITDEPHDLAVAAARALSDADDEAERAELTITTDLCPAAVNGDPALLDRLVSNLVDNAIRHNHPGGWVEVVTGRVGEEATVTVRNSGDRVPAAEVARLFEPFQRLASGRTAGSRSTGLGLAIVRSIVNAHNGVVTAVPNGASGLAVTVTLPAGRGPSPVPDDRVGRSAAPTPNVPAPGSSSVVAGSTAVDGRASQRSANLE